MHRVPLSIAVAALKVMPSPFGLASILRFYFGIDHRQCVTPQGPQLRPGLNHLGLGQHLRLPEHARRRPARGPLFGDELALSRSMGDGP
jgi:hypothetical protein